MALTALGGAYHVQLTQVVCHDPALILRTYLLSNHHRLPMT